MHYQPNHMGNFTLDMDRASFNNKVVPWLHATFGVKRGKKRDWNTDELPLPTGRPNTAIHRLAEKHHEYFCRVNLRHNAQCIAFLAKWGDHCTHNSRVASRNLNPPTARLVVGDWPHIAPMVRWMHRNLKPNEFQLVGSFRKYYSGEKLSWAFYLFTDSAEMAFLMIKPSG